MPQPDLYGKACNQNYHQRYSHMRTETQYSLRSSTVSPAAFRAEQYPLGDVWKFVVINDCLFAHVSNRIDSRVAVERMVLLSLPGSPLPPIYCYFLDRSVYPSVHTVALQSELITDPAKKEIRIQSGDINACFIELQKHTELKFRSGDGLCRTYPQAVIINPRCDLDSSDDE